MTDSQLRRIRILYNLLKTSLNGEKIADETAPKPSPKAPKKTKKKSDDASPEKDGTKKEKKDELKKVKGPKRYVVFLGNLPLDIDKEKVRTKLSILLKF